MENAVLSQKSQKITKIGQFLIIYQVLFLIGLPFYLYFGTVQTSVAVTAFILYFLTGISITAGYHRLYSHRAYKAHPVYEIILLFFGTLATQSSVIRWCFDHRHHHAYVDTDRDPYSINKGFWYAHFKWMLHEQEPIDRKVVADLYDNKALAFQDKYYLPLVIGANALVFLFFGWLFADFWGAFFLILWGRMFFLHHSTWFINSLAHTWGDKPFSQEHSAVNNFVISLLTFGEGYHNFHHTFANDYRNGVYWYQFDPTKWLIWTMHKLGFTYNLKVTNQVVIKKRMVIEHKQLLTEKLQSLWGAKKDELQTKIDSLSAQLLENINKLQEISNQINLLDSLDSELLNNLRSELKQIKSHMRSDWYAWRQLSRQILRQKPLKA